MRDRVMATRGPSRVLLIARCDGSRCAGLHRLREENTSLRAAVRRRPDAVLMTTLCLGHCELAAVAAVGWARSAHNSLAWLGPPVLLERTDTAERAAALASWVTAGAPEPGTLPDGLIGSVPG